MELKVTFLYFGWGRLGVRNKVLFLLIKFLDYGIIIIVNERGGFAAHREDRHHQSRQKSSTRARQIIFLEATHYSQPIMVAFDNKKNHV